MSVPENAGGPAANGAQVVYDGVAKRYGAVQALAPTSLEVASGEFFSIIGPSGSGKTTLLGVTAGFIPPSEGRILVDGRDLVGIPPFQRNLGMVFQHYSLFPHMTVAQNIGFPLRMRKVAKAEAGAQIKRILDVVRLSGMADRYPAQLSGGQQQRVALARAAVYNPSLLLMDEPLSALDKNLREEMQREIKAFQQVLGATVIYVTHDQHEASAMSHRIAIMNGGQVAQVGRPRDLYDNPRNRFVASFLGEANLFEVARHAPAPGGGTVIETPQGLTLRAADAPPDSRFVVCVRPEKIALKSGDGGGAECNRLTGTVSDVVHSSGTVHHRVRVAPEVEINQRSTGGAGRQFEVGEAVSVTWAPGDTQLVAVD
ncbi:MAG: ABC transporter ATP-binding protein [Proteobacteria bacterium]|nr:ABC transporter ATP-binding protein [Pseudomonadota bacterium]